jgi:NAD(P)H-dependent FMN reductase
VEKNMQSTINILGAAGSMRADSYSTRALKIALQYAKKYGANVLMLDLSKTVLSLRDPSAPTSEQAEEEVVKAVEWADAFILASPDYHGSMSGTLKNFLDHFYKEFGGKLFGYIVASHEKGLTVMDQMRTVMRQCYGWSTPYGVSVNGEQDFANGQLINIEVSRRLEMMSRDLVAYDRLISEQFARDLESSELYTLLPTTEFC